MLVGSATTSLGGEHAIDAQDAAAVDALTAKVTELGQICAGLSAENTELKNLVSGLLARTEPALPASSRATSGLGLPGGQNGADGVAAGLPLAGSVSRRTIGKAIGAAAAGVVGAAAFAELGRHSAAAASSGAPSTADAEDTAFSEPDAELAVAAGTGAASVINVSVSTTGAVVVATNSGGGAGIQGDSKSGRGGVFGGSAAQVQLTPGAKSHPARGERGDLYADSTGRLWFCKKSGSRATWHQIA